MSFAGRAALIKSHSHTINTHCQRLRRRRVAFADSKLQWTRVTLHIDLSARYGSWGRQLHASWGCFLQFEVSGIFQSGLMGLKGKDRQPDERDRASYREVRIITCTSFCCVADLANDNEVRMEAVHRKSVGNNDGVHGIGFWTVSVEVSSYL